jgi:hypothetical protein
VKPHPQGRQAAEQATKIELTINMKSDKALGPRYSADAARPRADEVIE